jgi:STE24 endopeptidase
MRQSVIRDARLPPRSAGRRAPTIAFAVLALALVLIVVCTTPWHPVGRPAGGRVPTDVSADFDHAYLQRENAYHHQLWPAVLGGVAAALLATLLLGLTPLGARLVRAVAQPLRGGWWARLLIGTVLLTALIRLASLPFDVWRQHLQRDAGIVVQGWSGFGADVAIGYGISVAGVLIAALVFFGLVRWVRRWWIPGVAIAALLVIGTSYVYPLVVEPAFNDFSSMPAGPLRTSLLQLAADDHVRVSDVLVADESKRSTRLNAYVSGIGSSRRIVVYDTTLNKLPPEQIRSIIAHELGHVKRNDVLHGTAEGALGAGAAVCLVFVLVQSSWLRRQADVTDVRDPSALALLLALVALFGAVSTPVQLLVSRRIEARADVHSLTLTRDPGTLIAMQRQISENNLADLDPPWPEVWFYATHPTGPQRIAQARTWAELNGVPVPPPSVGQDR